MEQQQASTLAEAMSRYLQKLGAAEQAGAQQALSRFVRWCGRERRFHELTPSEIKEYADQMAGEPEGHVAVLRAFLAFAKGQGLVQSNLATHLKVRRGPKRIATPQAGKELKAVQLTSEGYAQLQTRLEWLRSEMVRMAEEIRKAAADKDVRENAPLETAREYQGQVASRIRELEETLKLAVAMQNGSTQASQGPVQAGSRVTLMNLADQRQFTYVLVDPREASPLDGRISTASPVGQALLEKREGDEVQVAAPRGTVRLRILKVE